MRIFLQGKDWAPLGGSWEFVGEVSSTGSKSSAPRDASGLTLCSISPAEVNFRSCRSVEESCSIRGQGETGPRCRRAAVPAPRGMLPGAKNLLAPGCQRPAAGAAVALHPHRASSCQEEGWGRGAAPSFTNPRPWFGLRRRTGRTHRALLQVPGGQAGGTAASLA